MSAESVTLLICSKSVNTQHPCYSLLFICINIIQTLTCIYTICFFLLSFYFFFFFFFQAEDGIRDVAVTGVQTCALPIFVMSLPPSDLTWWDWSTSNLVRWQNPVKYRLARAANHTVM